ncbi:MAG TPA: hypothetical protein DDZ88_29620 [Verrucomicrobiales bacterium]|nr:hypothetical protein [Verrucomicrobiales bacterium]
MVVPLLHGLPLVEVRIGHSDAFRELCERNLDPVPPDITVIDSALVRRLRLRDRGVCRVRGFDGSLHADPVAREYLNYDISLVISDAEGVPIVRIGDLQSVGAPLNCEDYEVLLGLDVLRHCTVTLSFAEETVEILSACR